MGDKDKDDVIRTKTLTSRGQRGGVTVRTDHPARPLGEGENEAVLIQQFLLQR